MKSDKHYVSEIDKKMAEFDQAHPKSASQQAEIAKHQRVYALRDNAVQPEPDDETLFED